MPMFQSARRRRAVTSTFESSCPISSVMFTDRDEPDLDAVWTEVLKPGRDPLTEYVPAGTLGKLYTPSSLVIWVLVIPVPVLVSVMVTPGTRAPEAS